MKKSHRHLRRGVLSFEWILICVVLVVGIIGGLAAVRHSFLQEMADTANAIEAINVHFVDPPTP